MEQDLRQGCVLAPLLFNIFFAAVINVVLTCDSITVPSTWEFPSVSMRYSHGDGVNTSLSRLVYCTGSLYLQF